MTNQDPQTHRKSKYCELCPCKLGIKTPSPMAMERIHYMQAENGTTGRTRKSGSDSKDIGCDWYINSADFGYCFWEFSKTLTSPVPDKEICQLLAIKPSQLKEDYQSAVKKLQGAGDTPEMREFLAIILEKIQADKKMDIFQIQEGYENSADKNKDDKPETEMDLLMDIIKIKQKKRGRSSSGQPLHRDGRKVDLYGLQKKMVKKSDKKD